MIMKVKIIVIGIVCGCCIIAGISYYVLYSSKQKANYFETSLVNNSSSTSDQNNIATKAEHLTENDIVVSETNLSHKTEEENSDKSIFVHICGAVLNADVYCVKEGSRVIDVIKLAGGLRKDAAGEYINQAQIISDGQRIYIPSKEEVMDLTPIAIIEENNDGTSAKNAENSLININQANLNELMKLPGVGQAKANSIIEYRDSNGYFQKTEDIMKIPGIKEGLYQKIAYLITVN